MLNNKQRIETLNQIGEREVLNRLKVFMDIGQIDDENNGISGLELSFDYELRTSEKNLNLSLDTDLQYLIREELLKAKEFFNKNDYKIQTRIFKNCEHRIPTEGSSIGLEFLKKNLYKQNV